MAETQVSQIVVEVLNTGVPKVQVAQVVVEVLRTLTDDVSGPKDPQVFLFFD